MKGRAREKCPVCQKALRGTGPRRADLEQPWSKVAGGKVRSGYKIVGLHEECLAANPRRFTSALFARPTVGA
jgi:hypothetical protein